MPRLDPRRLVTAVTTAGVAACAVVAFAPAASASGLPAPTVSATTVNAGQSFTISGTGCVDPAPGADLPHFTVDSTQLGDGGQVRPDGSWSISTSFGMGTDAGAYPVQAACIAADGSPLGVYPTVTVTIPGAVPAPPPAAPSPVPPPAPRPAPTTARPTTTVSTTAPQTAVTAASTPTSTPPPGAVATAPPSPTPAAGCPDCARLVGGQPLRPGDDLNLSYAGFQPGEQVTFVLHSTPVTLGAFPADASGVVTTKVTIPAALEAGAHTLTLSGPVTGDRVVGFRLAAASAPAAAHRAAAAGARGSSPLPLVFGTVGVLLVLGAGAGVALRRRRADQPLTPTPISSPMP